MKNFCLILLLGFVSLDSFAQYFTIDTIKGESPYNKEFSFIFPHLKSTSDQTMADAINTDLVKDVLNMEYGTQKYSIFEKIWGTKELDLPNVSNISYKVINNDADFFCLKISATSCSSSCNDWTRYYIYDSKSGRKVTMNDLLTGAGLSMVSDSAYRLFTQRENTYSAQLKDKIAKQPLSPDDKQAYQSAIDAYGKCSGKNQLWAAPDKQHFNINADACLFGELHYLDKVDYSCTFDMSGLRDYLTDYGKSLFK